MCDICACLFNDSKKLKEYKRFYCTISQTFYISSKIVAGTRNLIGRDHLQGLGLGGWILLDWIN
jgi:hypothetical protein